MTIVITASKPTRSADSRYAAMDVDIAISGDSIQYPRGGVTLWRSPDTGRYVRSGPCRDHWVDGGLLRELSSRLDDHEVSAVLDEIEEVARAAIRTRETAHGEVRL